MNVCFSFQKYKEFERAVRVEEMDGLRLVKRLAEDMEEMFHKKAQAMKVLVSTWIIIHYTKSSLELSKTFKIQNNSYKSTGTCKNGIKNRNYFQYCYIYSQRGWEWKRKGTRLSSVKSLSKVFISDHSADPIWCLKKCCSVTLPQWNQTHLAFAVCMCEICERAGAVGEVTDRERLWATHQCLCHFIDRLRPDISI